MNAVGWGLIEGPSPGGFLAAIPGCCTGRVKLGTDLGKNSRLMHRNGSGAILTTGTHTSTEPTM